MSLPSLYVALDVPSLAAARHLADRLSEADRLEGRYRCGVKIGSQLFTAAGPAAIKQMNKRGFKVFLDLKYHDIPNTVDGAVRAAVQHGVSILNVHAGGGKAMMALALNAASEEAAKLGVERPLVLAVTVLTSLDRMTLVRDLDVTKNPGQWVLFLAERALEVGLDGVVASAQELVALRTKFGADPIILTPALRPAGAETGDQMRVDTIKNAARNQATFFVVGRPITQASDPAEAVRQAIEEITEGRMPQAVEG